MRLRVLREAGGGAYTAVGTGPTWLVAATSGHPLITIPVSPGLPICSGDIVGLESLTAGSATAEYTSSAFAYAFWSAPPADGATRVPNSNGLPRELVTQETIEPTNTFQVGGVERHKRKGTATIRLNLPNAGDLTASGNGAKVAGATSKSVGEGAAKLLVKARGKKRSALNRTGRVKLSVAITYTPTGGTANTERVKVKLQRG